MNRRAFLLGSAACGATLAAPALMQEAAQEAAQAYWISPQGFWVITAIGDETMPFSARLRNLTTDAECSLTSGLKVGDWIDARELLWRNVNQLLTRK